MSASDRDRLQVLHEVGKGQLGVTERWVRTLVARMRKEGEGEFCTGVLYFVKSVLRS